MRSCYASRVPARSAASGDRWAAVPCLATGNLHPCEGGRISKVKHLTNKPWQRSVFFNIVYKSPMRPALDRSGVRQKKPFQTPMPYIFVSQYCQAGTSNLQRLARTQPPDVMWAQRAACAIQLPDLLHDEFGL